MELSNTDFNLIEFKVNILDERWNIVFPDNENWLPHEQSIRRRGGLPHGFRERDTEGMLPEYKQSCLEWGRCRLYPFDVHLRH